MARGVNKVILVGNLGSDPELRYTPSGTAVAAFSIAVSESWKDKQTGEKQERTEWVRVVAYNRTAEIAGDYLRKGAQVYVEGRLQTRKWLDKTNVERTTTEVILSDLQLLGKKETYGAGPHEPAARQPHEPHEHQPFNPSDSPTPKASYSEGSTEKESFDDDDIPF